MAKPLGEKQELVLASLRRHKYWHENCGWIWDTPSGTKKVLDSLVKRGLVEITKAETGEDKYTPVNN